MEAVSVGIALRALGGDGCGDQGAWWSRDGVTVLALADGLGHGRDAEVAARAALAWLAGRLDRPLAELFRGCDQAIRGTRGAALGLAVIDRRHGELTFAGVGNTRAQVAGARTVNLVSNPGIVGGGYRHLTPETVAFAPGDVVFLFTDGIDPHVRLDGYPPDLRRDPPRLARTLVEDWGKSTDDAGVLAFRYDQTGRDGA